MRRKILIGVILVVLLIGLTGYFTNGMRKPKVGLCFSGAGSALENALREEMIDIGYTVCVRSGENDQEQQNAQIKALLQEGVDVVVVQPVDAAAASQILQITLETPVIFVGDEPDALHSAYYVGCDITQQGLAQVQLLETFFGKADINGDKCVDYMVISGPEDVSASQSYLQSVAAAMSNYAAAPLKETYCINDAAMARNICYDAISAYGRDLELILCHNDAAAQGAVKAVRDKGLTPGRDVIIFAIGTDVQLRELVRTGALTAAVVEDANVFYERVIQLVEALMKGKETDHKQYISYKVWTIDNVNS